MPKAEARTETPVQDDLALPATYEEAVEELGQLVQRLESGEVALDELLTGYQRGNALLAFCKARLQAVEDQIQVLDAGTLQGWKAP